MMLDECPPWPVARERAAAALDRTNRWARRARAAWDRAPAPAACSASSRAASTPSCARRAAAELAAIDFDGYAIGGVSVGEPAAERRAMVEATAPLLPADRAALPDGRRHAGRHPARR